MAEIETIKISENASIDFEINFSFNIAAAEWEKNPMDYYFSIQYLFMVNASQGIPFYIVKNSDFYEKHFQNPMLEFCEQKEKNDYIIKVSIPADRLYQDCLANGKSSFLFFMPCIYASEDGYSYTNGVKDLVVDFKYKNYTWVFYSLGNDTITFSGYND